MNVFRFRRWSKISGAATSEIQTYLKDIDYPVSKSDLINHAKAHGATKDVLDILNRLPEQQYKVPTDVNEAVGKIR